MTPSQFQALAAHQLSNALGVTLTERTVNVGSVAKRFDLVSEDKRIIGDAKFYKICRVPSAKLATITECVFLLERCLADRRFIVFGNDKAVPLKWLQRYGALLDKVTFYFLGKEGLEQLN